MEISYDNMVTIQIIIIPKGLKITHEAIEKARKK